MPAKFEIKHGGGGEYMFNLKAPNGEVILTSQMYKEKQDVFEGIAAVMANAHQDVRFERKTAKNGQPFFLLKAANGETIGKSETYSSLAAMENGIQSVQKNAAAAEVHELAA